MQSTRTDSSQRPVIRPISRSTVERSIAESGRCAYLMFSLTLTLIVEMEPCEQRGHRAVRHSEKPVSVCALDGLLIHRLFPGRKTDLICASVRKQTLLGEPVVVGGGVPADAEVASRSSGAHRSFFTHSFDQLSSIVSPSRSAETVNAPMN
jgi:hypothetical protein